MLIFACIYGTKHYVETWERYKGFFENQPEWFFYLVTFIICFGFLTAVYRLYQFSQYLVWGIVLTVLMVWAVYNMGDTFGWSYYDN